MLSDQIYDHMFKQVVMWLALVLVEWSQLGTASAQSRFQLHQNEVVMFAGGANMVHLEWNDLSCGMTGDMLGNIGCECKLRRWSAQAETPSKNNRIIVGANN